MGKRIRELRTLKQLSQEGLAEACGLSWHFISALERGKKAATVESLLKISSSLDVTLSELFLGVAGPPAREAKRLATALAGKPTRFSG